MFKNALVSVTNKTGLADFLRPYVENGLRVVSTGGTAKYLKDNGIAVVEVSDQTGFPEVMNGRVRTLHPKVHMALLARNEIAEDMNLMREYGIEPFDLVIGNLYEFSTYAQKKTEDRALTEYIDIGGPALLRAAAKNYHQITVICDPEDYHFIKEKSTLTLEERKKLAAKVFQHISVYDSQIASVLSGEEDFFSKEICIGMQKVSELRYGENPQQKATWYKDPLETEGLHSFQILQGKSLSYNNLLDLDAALSVVNLFEEACCIGVKHNNPCGVARGYNIDEVVEKCLSADPKSIFGGIIATNREVDVTSAKKMSSVFLECILAPAISSEALQILSQKKNLRLLVYPNLKMTSKYQIKSILGGYLRQTTDHVTFWDEHWNILGEKPSQDIQNDLSFSWRVCSALKSNAISIVSHGQTVGLGMGQVSRVDSVLQAIERMKMYHPNVKNPVLASDAFFPFEDSMEIIAKAGIRWVIQPGGSVRDEDVIKTAQKLGVHLVLTGVRHFKH